MDSEAAVLTPALLPRELLPQLREALAHGGNTHTVGDVVNALLDGAAQLWVDEGALLVTEVETYPRLMALHFWLAAGELSAVIALSQRAMEWGRSIGCTRASLSGRRGWERALAAEGWAATRTVMERAL
jgi:hypothetical protein